MPIHCGAIALAGTSFLTLLIARKLFSKSNEIVRTGTNFRASTTVVHGGVVYLSGQVGKINPTTQALDGDVGQQTEETLAKVDSLLKAAGTDKTRILSANIWLKDIKADFAPMNEVWNKWVGEAGDLKGVRACVESAMARESILVEVQIVAAL